MAKKTDDKTLQLIRQVRQQKEEIAAAERPNWITNCSFSYGENGSSPINLHVESNIRTLVRIAAFLLAQEREYKAAADQLGVDAPEFTWSNYSVKDWMADIRCRINKVQIAAKRQKLESLEARLNSIISPDLRAQMELDAIAAELG